MTTSLEKVKAYLINPGNTEQIWVGNNYFPEALRQQKAKYVSDINCTATLKNLLDGRCSPLSIEEIEGEIKDVTEYVKDNKAIINSYGFFRVHGDLAKSRCCETPNN